MISGDVAEHMVRQIEVVHENLFILVLERNGLEFMLGDCVALQTGAGKSRPYSIASGTREGDLRFVIRNMAEGEVSPWLMARNYGDAVGVSAPFGWFRPGQEVGDSPFILEAIALGAERFSFTGGEPFVIPDMAAILDYALDYKPCQVLTNANEPLLNRLHQIAPLVQK